MQVAPSTTIPPLDKTQATKDKQPLEVDTIEVATSQTNTSNTKMAYLTPKMVCLLAPKIDWLSLKSEYLRWRSILWEETESTLKKMARENVSLAALNILGIFHKVATPEARSMKLSYEVAGIVPHRWIYKGNFPGIWCALFHQENTHSFGRGISFFKFTFHPEYRIFDPLLEEHKKLWEAWKSVQTNIAEPNLWENVKNDVQKSLKDRIGFLHGVQMPDHFAFYKEHGFGAIVGYSDYMACLIIEEKAIPTVSLLEQEEAQEQTRPIFKLLGKGPSLV